mmetsp:Transcript_1134/g.2349  ORF Transcript_1134/g.2349 Transcript_1134/m.2349 type:complete len:254 (-) Transcript_1134:2867-3628(-)
MHLHLRPHLPIPVRASLFEAPRRHWLAPWLLRHECRQAELRQLGGAGAATEHDSRLEVTVHHRLRAALVQRVQALRHLVRHADSIRPMELVHVLEQSPTYPRLIHQCHLLGAPPVDANDMVVENATKRLRLTVHHAHRVHLICFICLIEYLYHHRVLLDGAFERSRKRAFTKYKVWVKIVSGLQDVIAPEGQKTEGGDCFGGVRLWLVAMSDSLHRSQVVGSLAAQARRATALQEVVVSRASGMHWGTQDFRI